MDSPDSGRAQILRRQRPSALQAFVHEGEIVGDETPEGQIRLLHQILETLTRLEPGASGSPPDFIAELTELLRTRRLSAGDEFRLAGQASALLRHSLPFSEEDLRVILEFLVGGGIRASIADPLLTRLLRHVERFAEANGLPASLRSPLERRHDRLRRYAGANRFGRLRISIERLLEPDDAALPDSNEGWAVALRAFLSSLDADNAAQWRSLLAHGAAVEQTRPSAAWLRAARNRVDAIGAGVFRRQALLWLNAAAEPCERPLSERNSVVLKGLAWTCSVDDAPETARALATLAEALLRWLHPYLDWRGLKAGNACLNALAMMNGPEPLAQLARLSQRLKGKQLQTSVNRAIEVAIQRRGLPREDLEELTIPTHGLDANGRLHTEIGGAQVEIVVTPEARVEWRWFAGGVEQRTPPAGVREGHATELRALRLTAKAISATVSAQQARLEQLCFDDRSWRLIDWRSRYLEHPVLSPLTRALVWRIHAAPHADRLAILGDEGLIDIDGLPLAHLTDDSIVRLWHPTESEPDVIEAWRRHLREAGLTQPFKQVDRETYRITPDEWRAGASARFAGRVLRQQQFSALCRGRGWQYALQGPWHGSPPRAIRLLPRWSVQAELWVNVVGSREVEGTSTGFHPYVSSDLLRFQAADGGACLLTDVPERVISEVLRDVDLFVSAAAVATASTESERPASARRTATAPRGGSRRRGSPQTLPSPAPFPTP